MRLATKPRTTTVTPPRALVEKARPLWRALPHACIDTPIDVVTSEGSQHIVELEDHGPVYLPTARLPAAKAAFRLRDVVDVIVACAPFGFRPAWFTAKGFPLVAGRPRIAIGVAVDEPDDAMFAKLIGSFKRAVLTGDPTPPSRWSRLLTRFIGAGLPKALAELAADDDVDPASLSARLTAWLATSEAHAAAHVDNFVNGMPTEDAYHTRLWPLVTTSAELLAFPAVMHDVVRDLTEQGAVGEILSRAGDVDLTVCAAIDAIEDLLIAIAADADIPQLIRGSAVRALGLRRSKKAAPSLQAILVEPVRSVAWLHAQTRTALWRIPVDVGVVVDSDARAVVAACPHAWGGLMPSAGDIQRTCAECGRAVVRARDLDVIAPAGAARDADSGGDVDVDVLARMEEAIVVVAGPLRRTLRPGDTLRGSGDDATADIKSPMIDGAFQVMNAGRRELVAWSEFEATAVDAAHPELRGGGANNVSFGPLAFCVDGAGVVRVSGVDIGNIREPGWIAPQPVG